jgi:hypothetical protein
MACCSATRPVLHSGHRRRRGDRLTAARPASRC